jgi:hypothetical protein
MPFIKQTIYYRTKYLMNQEWTDQDEEILSKMPAIWQRESIFTLKINPDKISCLEIDFSQLLKPSVRLTAHLAKTIIVNILKAVFLPEVVDQLFDVMQILLFPKKEVKKFPEFRLTRVKYFNPGPEVLEQMLNPETKEFYHYNYQVYLVNIKF